MVRILHYCLTKSGAMPELSEIETLRLQCKRVELSQIVILIFIQFLGIFVNFPS